MANYADALVLIWNGSSKGSADMLRKATEKGLPCYVVTLERFYNNRA
jgi:hypothetical protein